MIRRSARAPEDLAAFEVRLPIHLRLARQEDLGPLEWFGWFTPHRTFIEEAFRRQGLGEVRMLVAIADDFPVGQLWVDLTRKAPEGVGILWALRVLPGFQRMGIATQLIASAESLLREQGMQSSEIGVERDSPDVRRFYERLGYAGYAVEREVVRFPTPEGRIEFMVIDQWLLRKTVAPTGRRAKRIAVRGPGDRDGDEGAV